MHGLSNGTIASEAEGHFAVLNFCNTHNSITQEI